MKKNAKRMDGYEYDPATFWVAKPMHACPGCGCQAQLGVVVPADECDHYCHEIGQFLDRFSS